MSATHTPAAVASKKRALQELKDQRALGGKDSYQSMSARQQTPPPPLRSTAPPTNLAGAGDRRGGSAHRPPPLPRFPTRALHPTYPRPRSWPAQSPGGSGGVSRGRSGGGGGPICTICTNAAKPANHHYTPCPLTTCHKCGQPGHIQHHCPN